jgi:hypothetical protein
LVKWSSPAAERVHGEERVIYGVAGPIGIEKREAFKDSEADIRIAMKLGERRVLPDTAIGRLLDLIESAKVHFRAKVEHPFGSSNVSLDSERSSTEASERTISSSK